MLRRFFPLLDPSSNGGCGAIHRHFDLCVLHQLPGMEFARDTVCLGVRLSSGQCVDRGPRNVCIDDPLLPGTVGRVSDAAVHLSPL